MGGSGGGIIVRNAAVRTLKDPIVHGQLPTTMVSGLDSVLAVDPSMWSQMEREIVGRAFHWALCNLL